MPAVSVGLPGIDGAAQRIARDASFFQLAPALLDVENRTDTEIMSAVFCRRVTLEDEAAPTVRGVFACFPPLHRQAANP